MSLIQTVAGIVRERGTASACDITVPGASHRQIVKALQNARLNGLIVLCDRGTTTGRPAVYAPRQEPRGSYGIGRVTSVFHLADSSRRTA